MKKHVLLLSVFLLTGCLFNDNPRPGYFDPLGSIIWKGKINLTENHYIGTSDTLIIEKGTTITFHGNVTLLIDGSLKIRGTSIERVKFINSGHVLLSSLTTGNEIAWCEISESDLTLASGASIVSSKIKDIELLNNANPVISNSSIGYMNCENTASPTVRKSQFDRNGFFSDLTSVVIRTHGTSFPDIQECNILGNSSITSVMTDQTVQLYSSTQQYFENNWWTINDSVVVTNKLVFKSGATTLWYTPIANVKLNLATP